MSTLKSLLTQNHLGHSIYQKRCVKCTSSPEQALYWADRGQQAQGWDSAPQLWSAAVLRPPLESTAQQLVRAETEKAIGEIR